MKQHVHKTTSYTIVIRNQSRIFLLNDTTGLGTYTITILEYTYIKRISLCSFGNYVRRQWSLFKTAIHCFLNLYCF